MADYKEITGVSYFGSPRDNTAMFVTKKVSYLIENLRGFHHCLVFTEDGIDVPEDIICEHSFRFSDNPQREYALFAIELEAKRIKRDSLRRYTLTDGGYYIGENVVIGKTLRLSLCALSAMMLKSGMMLV